ncbi:hypothetical protein IU449_10220 [Nocardia higoensis]|uniref:Uncharacterized protein n=2 Tax=Nocardia higoensis TaxID=228599 RepID=A0ABS0DBB6_9NOCA|nr:hypothetical protein [Nocardia higoensis]
MAMVHWDDPDFRVCRVGFDALRQLQQEAECFGLATRWSSEEALRKQVKIGVSLLIPFMREERQGGVRAYRCLVLFPTVEDATAGGVATIDVRPDRLSTMNRIDRDEAVRQALAQVFSLAQGGISMVSKE